MGSLCDERLHRQQTDFDANCEDVWRGFPGTLTGWARTKGSRRRQTASLMESEESEDRLTAARMRQKLLESTGKEGVYYVIRFPTRWRLYSFSWEDFGKLSHADAWRQYASVDLADTWNVAAEELKPFWECFPRGRIERVGPLQYTVFHGDDIDGTGVTPKGIETAFELGRSAVKWSFDPHEKQNPEHQAALLRLLPNLGALK